MKIWFCVLVKKPLQKVGAIRQPGQKILVKKSTILHLFIVSATYTA